jgi:hypothetical protein
MKFGSGTTAEHYQSVKNLSQEYKMPLFEVAIVQKPTKKELDEGTGVEKLVFGPTAVIARDAQSAAITAVTGPSAPTGLDMTRAEVIVRPFQ